MGRITGLPLPALLVPPMALSRLVLGVHYPSDVATGDRRRGGRREGDGVIADRIGGGER